ncbi:Protein of unknown function [Chitinophaga costaii]|uniref:Uncharacterized protein n=1 Tax=Chitinophaga costaii TaxID=1335309 RepID=A0A1C3YYX1_9BACT|nr:DUF3375 domain-containing protein [Chitinophaga costaii]PUZ30160.1 DUF3375 domain-containing protein [Chitinophaga costaii]SCB75285.1 Protein of unknown function [Chitinophaga costaii]
MKQADLAFLFDTHPAVRMLRQRSGQWVLPFLYRVFKEDNRFLISEQLLIQLLAEQLIVQEDGIEDFEEARIAFGENEETRSRKYVISWVQQRILQDLQDADGQVQYQLSAHTEKAFQWMQTLQGRHHVGTESRFKLLFNSLRDVVEKTEDDRSKRLAILKDKRAEIDKEIKAIELGLAPDNYTNAQVQERLELFTRLCYDLVSDFREVEDNFKHIHRAIVEQHTRATQHKGAIVGFAFEAYDALRNSSQGKSFYAFWDFLISREGQQDWKALTDQLLELVKARQIPTDETFLQNVKSMLLEQGKAVYDANDKMAEKLSRIITEKEIARHKRLRQQISNIKEMIFSLMDEAVPCGLEVADSVPVKMIMDRRLQLEGKKQELPIKQPVAATEKIEDVTRFSRMVSTTHIDRKQLWKKVEDVLAVKTTATLREVLEMIPLQNGLAEIVSYYSFLRDKGGQVQVLPNITELVPLNETSTKFIEVPYLLFSK